MIQQTSLEAFQDIQVHVSERHEKILHVLAMQKDATDREITYLLAKNERNWVSPRRNELVKLGKIELSRKRECAISKKNAIAWRVCDGY